MKHLLTLLGALLLLAVPVVSLGADLSGLQTEVARDQAAQPDAYHTVAEMRSEAIGLDANKRGRYAITGPMLESLGASVHLALVSDLLEDEPFSGTSSTVRRSWRVGILHALGRSYDARFRAAYVWVMETDQDMEVVRAASSALGKLLDNQAAATLIHLASADSPNASSVLAGMGTCRRAATSVFLAQKLDTATTEDDALRLTLAIRDVANVWAWKTKRVATSGEAAAVRATAGKALVRALSRFPALESELTKALLIVDAPDSYLGALTIKGDADKLRIARVRARLKSNPLR